MGIKRKMQALRRKFFASQCRALNEVKKSTSVKMPENSNKAMFNFMIDFELIWGNGKLGGVDHTIEKRISDAEKQKENFSPFLNLVEELNFPTSWAILGKLGDINSDIFIVNKFKPNWAKCNDWYSLPDNIEISSLLIDGASYLNSIQSLKSSVEILSHGYAHIDYADQATTLEVAKNDLELSLEILRKYNKNSINSFVYPCNNHKFLELLTQNGINTVRGEIHEWLIKDDLIQTPLGFWISPGAMSFKELLPFLEKAIEDKCWIHPWMHLIECDIGENDLNEFYRPLFNWCLDMEKQGKLTIVKFSELKESLTQVKRA